MSGQSSSTSLLQFVPFASAVDIGFWHKLSKHKLEEFKLDDSAKLIHGTTVNNDPSGLPCRVNVDFTAFDERSQNSIPRTFSAPGSLIIKNTIDDFKNLNKKDLLNNAAKKLLEDISSDKISENPSLLNQFSLLVFADLKKYHFYYWFAFPAIVLKENFTVKKIQNISNKYNERQLVNLQHSYDQLQNQLGRDPFVFLLNETSDDSFSIGQLSDWESFYEKQRNVIVGYADPSTLPENPGWSLRNLLLYLSLKRKSNIDSLTILCYRDRQRDGKREISHSLLLEMNELPTIAPQEVDIQGIGWEKNQRGKLGPRMVDLSSTMDPVKLAESAVDLNLKLMRWRLMPELNLEKIASTRCLLLGSGTLGCNVGRSLMGWGVRKITFVDNSKVSYSNPVRQTLFQFDDCLNGGKKKAQAAADSMKRIFPGVETVGIELSIPMPGHAVGPKDEAKIREDVEKLESLIESHDVIFLLMDTRESRWLPTVVSISKEKLLINAALGFDTFMVMRHGYRTKDSDKQEFKLDSKTTCIPGSKLGCYFCNDVVAPGNSTQDRTLDQQCTVSRPGVSMMASALAVELLISVLQHPDGGLAAADTSANENHLQVELPTSLGIIPHQIRCFLSRFHTVLPATCAFNKCTGCSPAVVSAYEKDGFSFLLKVFNVPKFLEDTTGLTELHASINYDDVDELSDSDDEND